MLRRDQRGRDGGNPPEAPPPRRRRRGRDGRNPPPPEPEAPPPPPPNPLLQLRSVDWQLYEESLENAQSYRTMATNCRTEISLQGRAENGGNDKVVTLTAEGNAQNFQLTPDSGFFTVMLRQPQGWGGEQNAPPVPLIFSFSDLYLVGFVHENICYVFSDAKMDGIPEQFYVRLQFDGGHKRQDTHTVKLGLDGLYQTYSTLRNFPQRLERRSLDVEIALFRIIAVVSEAIRFPLWFNHFASVLERGVSESVDEVKHFSKFFPNWSDMSKRARRGEDRFEAEPGDVFVGYRQLLQCITLLLSRPPADQL
ncbi:hypothetical protein EJB05_21677, partial [Eragrostis curvula]